MVGDKHFNSRRPVRVHVEGENLLQHRAPGHVFIRNLMDGRGDRWTNEVRSDDDHLPTHEIDGSDLHHGVVWAGTGGLQISDSKEGGCFRGAGHAYLGPLLGPICRGSGRSVVERIQITRSLGLNGMWLSQDLTRSSSLSKNANAPGVCCRWFRIQGTRAES
jgi:hypothetical protein